MYYTIYCLDHNDSREKRRSVRPAHLQRLAELEKQGRLLIAGPLLQEDHDINMSFGTRGSLIIAEFENLEAAKAWAAADPYVTADVYERIFVSPFKKIFPNPNSQRMELMKKRLEDCLNPNYLDIQDESALHAGHEGAATGRGHFALTIKSGMLEGKPLVQQHRQIYEALGELMETDIHALRITVLL